MSFIAHMTLFTIGITCGFKEPFVPAFDRPDGRAAADHRHQLDARHIERVRPG